MAEKIDVGFIGLGNIGKPTASHLISPAYNVYVYDIYRPAVDELVEKGAIACSSVAEMAKACSHIGLCVLNNAQVEELLYGAKGILQNARENTIIAIHSTVTQAGIFKWAAAAADHGIKLIDAPITGGAQGAEAGKLCYMVGGDADTVHKASPVFQTSADKVVHAGELGTGIVLKLCNNLITYAEYLAMSEATRLAEAGGLSADVLREVGKSNAVINEQMHQFISNRNALAQTCTEEQMDEFFGRFGRLGEKDLDCALQTAASLNVELPSTQHLREVVMDLFMNRA